MSMDFYTSLRTCSNQSRSVSLCMPALKVSAACVKMSVFGGKVLGHGVENGSSKVWFIL
jgi:hypothetical protein